MHISVMVCTWNWADMLSRCLEHLSRQSIPDGVEWELIVVDNNSTDHTQSVIEGFSKKLPLRSFFEPQQGISFARNRAIEEAKGQLIIQIDTDALADKNLIKNYWEASLRWPKASYFGGKITPLFESDPPRWIKDNLHLLEGAILIRDLGKEERKLLPLEQAFGANLAYRKNVFSAKRFRTELGHIGEERLFGEETDVLEEVKAKGGYGVWVPSAEVQHFVSSSRVTRKYLRKYFYGQGRSSRRMRLEPKGPVLFGGPRPLYRQFLGEWCGHFIRRAAGKTNWVEYYISAYQKLGMIAECRAGIRNHDGGTISS